MDAIMNQNPAIAQAAILKRDSQRSKIKFTFRRLTFMTVKAGLLNQPAQRLGDTRRC